MDREELPQKKKSQPSLSSFFMTKVFSQASNSSQASNLSQASNSSQASNASQAQEQVRTGAQSRVFDKESDDNDDEFDRELVQDSQDLVRTQSEDIRKRKSEQESLLDAREGLS